jgi:hypothetical protein
MNNNKQYLKELYKLFLININENNVHTIQNKKQIMKCIENYLDKTILHNYESKYNTFACIYDTECNKTR